MATTEGAALPATKTKIDLCLPIAKPEDLDNFAFVDDNAMEVVRENLGGQDMSPSDFEKLKFPTGGGQSWEVFGLDGEPQSVKSIDGIVLMNKTIRVYWADEFTGEGTPPDCQSKDLITGVGTPGGLCATCPYAQWESDPKGGGGQACKTVGTLFVMRPGEMLPVIVPVPVASVQPLKKFMLSLSSKNIKYSNAIISIGLEQAQNKKGIRYSKLKPKLIAVLPDEAKEQIDRYIKAFRESMNRVTVSREDIQ
jgi:hypothetical protein